MQKYLLFCFIFAFCSCARPLHNTTVITLPFDVDNYKTLNLNKYPCICLDNKAEIGMVKSMKIVDSNLFIHSSAGLHLFSLNTGDLKTRYSRKGHGPEEYITLWSYNIADTVVQLYDINRKHILEYSVIGKFIRTIDIQTFVSEKPFQDFIEIGDNYLGKRVFSGDSDIPELALYDKNFRYQEDVLPELKLRSGLMLHKPFSLNSEGKALYCRYFDNVIYEIGMDSAKPIYFIDFNRNSFNSEGKFKDEYDIIEHINSSRTKYAVNFSDIQEDKNYLSFNYLYNSSKRMAMYNKNEGVTYSFAPISETESINQIYRLDNFLYILTQSDNGITKLYKCKFSDN